MSTNILRPACVLLLGVLPAVGACSTSRYTDGPLTQYLQQPLPALDKPIARSVTVEHVTYNTAGGMKGTMIGDTVGREIYFLPKDVGYQVDAKLRMNDAFSEKGTRDALNAIAKGKADARHISGRKLPKMSTAKLSSSSASYVKRHERLAQAAYRKGDYLGGDIHNGAAMNRMVIDQSFDRAQATVGLAFSVLGAASALGEMSIKQDFAKTRNWIVTRSGAVGEDAPEGSHLSVFLLEYLDGKKFKFDSRMRLAVYLVLTDKRGRTTAVLEGSDVLTCAKSCDLFQPKPTAKLFEKSTQSADMQKLYWTKEGMNSMLDNGFDPVGGIYQYVLLHHGLNKLAAKAK